MLRLVLILTLTLLPLTVSASPFLVSDPNPTAVGGWCEFTGASWLQGSFPLMPDGSVKVDMANAPVGRTDLQIRVCIDEPTWGISCSEWVPFGFDRPSGPSAAKGLRLRKN
ncbi:MAG: hypothetical protein QXT73_00450 [Candidatus Methanomethylicaceae archaeon]